MQYTIPIGRDTSRRIIDAAIAARAPVVIKPTGRIVASLRGSLIDGNDYTISIALVRTPPNGLDVLVGRYCDVWTMAAERYLFNSNVLDGPSSQDESRLVFQRPQTLLVVQRRRFWRARLAPSSHVDIVRSQDGRHQTTTARLMNVSGEGIACKLSGGSGRMLKLEDRVEIAFHLPACPTQFEFSAVVRNRVPSSEGGYIVGLQFDITDGDLAAGELRNELRQFLYGPSLVSADAGSFI
jgi:hypothetical protein